MSGDPASASRAASAERVAEALRAIHALFDGAASSEYLSEMVSVAGHSLRTAERARAAGAGPALVAAALLHDVGHMLDDDSAAALARSEDIRHEETGAAWLSRWFGPDVTEPVRLHVDAKRYLCAVDPGYYEILSPISRGTLAMQGGPLEGAELAAFQAGGHAEDAAAVRRWDDAGKDPKAAVPPLVAYDDLLASLVHLGG
ncbi:HD domain-containing protein [Frankia sp. CNm7]|uniref:HD domain-containing protein n=1 Tax=Frankia nepalensis TaxID=1836974 RepID=A0A937URU8_9ACTN|nr:HD domain-containing protein [Frankia nepalensis]MBL7502584.1 HD domain-containing protein [Frankia nepalensis]MBL7514651.1 HD domain-containing protein [Frankia nepalensis]MBL7521928.1 HD domain-containing protein [Frankia nepalensis]MBL7631757.1 HD domain-containing protein [Frankia nepalensis]